MENQKIQKIRGSWWKVRTSRESSTLQSNPFNRIEPFLTHNSKIFLKNKENFIESLSAEKLIKNGKKNQKTELNHFRIRNTHKIDEKLEKQINYSDKEHPIPSILSQVNS